MANYFNLRKFAENTNANDFEINILPNDPYRSFKQNLCEIVATAGKKILAFPFWRYAMNNAGYTLRQGIQRTIDKIAHHERMTHFQGDESLIALKALITSLNRNIPNDASEQFQQCLKIAFEMRDNLNKYFESVEKTVHEISKRNKNQDI